MYINWSQIRQQQQQAVLSDSCGSGFYSDKQSCEQLRSFDLPGVFVTEDDILSVNQSISTGQKMQQQQQQMGAGILL